jgi:hypothetical protein
MAPTTNRFSIKESYTRDEVISLLGRYGFHFSDNGDPDTDPHEWLNNREGVNDGYVSEHEEEDNFSEDEDEDEDEESAPWEDDEKNS